MIKDPSEVKEAKQRRSSVDRRVQTNKDQQARMQAAASAGQAQRAKPETYKREEVKVKRNDPCPCGSGKKYKQCHMKINS